MNRFVPDRPQRPTAPSTTPVMNGESEDELDTLLQKVEDRKVKQQVNTPAENVDHIAVFRARMRQIYQPVFNDLTQKYLDKGVEMEMDAEEFLGGGTNLKIKYRYMDMGLTLDGTVMRSGVAFYVTKSTGRTAGAVVSGPLMRIRNLSADEFRQFVIDHLMALVKDALRQT
ncbi:MAG: hypothetical protein HJJLKODD_02190 [Phycisphaerae bacterium]|nr:hypothetical protein [Phycisphaerae bacterium]